MSALRRVLTASRAVVRPQVTAAAVGARCASSWLQGRPPVVNTEAGTFAALYYKAVREFQTPTKDSLVALQQDLRMTVGDFDKLVYAYARGFIDALGLAPGDKVAVYIGNEVENLVVQYAAALTGASVVVVDPSADVSALQSVVASEGVKALFFSPRFGSEARISKIQEVFSEELDPFTYGATVGYNPIASKRLRGLKWIVQTGFEPVEGIVRLKDLPVFGEEGAYEHDEVAVAQHAVKAADSLSKYYPAAADGKLGAVKAVSHADSLATSGAAVKALKLTSADVMVITAPLYTHFGFAAGALAAASAHAKTVFPSKNFDAAKTLAAATVQRATVLVATQQQAEALATELKGDSEKPAEKRLYDISSLRGGLVVTESGSAISLGSVSLKAVKPAALPGAAAFN